MGGNFLVNTGSKPVVNPLSILLTLGLKAQGEDNVAYYPRGHWEPPLLMPCQIPSSGGLGRYALYGAVIPSGADV